MAPSGLSEAEAKKLFEEALKGPPGKLVYTPSKEQANQTKRFIVGSDHYYNCAAYILLAMAQPPTVERFNADYPEKDLKKLRDLDQNAYNDVRNALVNVNNHATAFQHKSMGKFLKVTNDVVAFCDTFQRFVANKGMLLDQIEILKKTENEGWNSGTDLAVKRACAILRRLAADAKIRAAQCGDLVSDLTLFRGLTEADQKLINNLYKNFITPGPGDGKKPYSEALEKDLADLRKEALAQKKRYDKEKENYDYYVVVAATTVTYAWIFPFGTIAAAATAGVYGDKAVKAKKAYAEAEAKKNLADDEIRNITRCINLVTNIVSEISNISAIIDKAIVAMRAMEAMFSRMESGLTEIANKAGIIDSTVSTASDFFWEAMITEDYKGLLAQWSEVKTLALSFAANKSINWENATPKQ